jgi:glycosyltransferase involved in cell wall biosynthesis
MKILIQFGNKGDSLVDHLISPLSRVNDLTSILVVSRYPGPSIPKVEYHCPPRLVARSTFLALICELFILFNLALFIKPDYIAGFLLNPHGLIAFIVAKLTRRKLIISLIAGIPELYTKGSIRGIDFNKTPPPWHGRLFLKILNHSDAIITTGSVTKRFLTKHGIEDNKIFPMINPANGSRFHPVPIPKVYDLISVSRLTLIKRHEIMLYAILKIKKIYPDIKACIVGDGSNKSKLIRLADKLGIQKNVEFAGFKKDTPFYYNSARIFFHTSEREGFPNVVLEAMLCGIPCVVSNCGDIIDIAKDGHNSLIIQDFSDIDGFAQAAIKLLGNKELYQNISLNALRTMESHPAEEVTNQWNLLFKMIKSHKN